MSPAQRLALTVLGYLFVLLGLVGILLPVLHGGFFLLVGLALLARTSPWAARVHAALARRFPKVAARAARIEARAAAWWARLRRRGTPPPR